MEGADGGYGISTEFPLSLENQDLNYLIYFIYRVGCVSTYNHRVGVVSCVPGYSCTCTVLVDLPCVFVVLFTKSSQQRLAIVVCCSCCTTCSNLDILLPAPTLFGC